MTYRTIVADPPWRVERVIRAGGRRRNQTAVPYEFLADDAIAQLPVHALAADDATLFLWSTRQRFRDGVAARVARAWGFEPVGEIIWGLRNAGMGTRSIANDHEPVLIATRGRSSIEADQPLGVWFWRQVYEYGPAGVPQKVHSAKPPAFQDLVEQVSPGPYLELFARSQRLGWDTWGDEALEHVVMSRGPGADTAEDAA